MEQNNLGKTYYERIREIRKENHISQTEIAKLLCVVQKTYSDYETGRIRLPIDSLLKLAKFYNISPNYLLGASDVKKPYPKK